MRFSEHPSVIISTDIFSYGVDRISFFIDWERAFLVTEPLAISLLPDYLDPVAIGIGDEVDSHLLVDVLDASHLLVLLPCRFHVIGSHCKVELLIPEVIGGLFEIPEPGELQLEAGAAIEIKMGQGAKPGIGGHLPGLKVGPDISKTRMIPEGTDAISPAPHHDIYSIEDLRQLVYSLKEATEYKKPVMVKIAAVNNVAAVASGVARSGADIICIDGYRGGTGAAPTRIRDNVGIPIELALAAVDQRLRDEGIRDEVSVVVGGSIRNSADLLKAIALGADACYIGTAALLAMGCHLCRTCQTGKCNWGIATQRPELVKRLNPDIGSQRLINLLTAWDHELKEMMGGMGINSIEALRGNRLMLRGIGLTDRELNILGIKHAGE